MRKFSPNSQLETGFNKLFPIRSVVDSFRLGMFTFKFARKLCPILRSNTNIKYKPLIKRYFDPPKNKFRPKFNALTIYFLSKSPVYFTNFEEMSRSELPGSTPPVPVLVVLRTQRLLCAFLRVSGLQLLA